MGGGEVGEGVQSGRISCFPISEVRSGIIICSIQSQSGGAVAVVLKKAIDAAIARSVLQRAHTSGHLRNTTPLLPSSGWDVSGSMAVVVVGWGGLCLNRRDEKEA